MSQAGYGPGDNYDWSSLMALLLAREEQRLASCSFCCRRLVTTGSIPRFDFRWWPRYEWQINTSSSQSGASPERATFQSLLRRAFPRLRPSFRWYFICWPFTSKHWPGLIFNLGRAHWVTKMHD